jgi:DNA repair exonuclease SbcCD ATPase subunit
MGRIGITYQQVANTAERLQGQERNPTVDSIREILGTGSKSTIARYLKEWRSKNEQSGGPSGIPQDLFVLVKGLWDQLQAQAEQQIIKNQEEANQEIKLMEEKWGVAERQSQDLYTQVHQLEESLFQQKEANTTLAETLTAEQLETYKNQERIRSLEDHLEAQKSENIKLHALLKNIQNNLEHYHAATQKLQHENSLVLDKQKNHFEKELSNLRHQLADAINEKSFLTLQIEKMNHQLLDLEQFKNQNQILEKTLREYEIRVITLEENTKIFSSQNIELSRALDEKRQALTASEQKAAITTSHCEDFKQALKQAEDKISTLRHEQLFIAQEKANLEGQLKQLQKINRHLDMVTERKNEEQIENPIV